MAFGNWPVASFRQRIVYKTEFDIFKQNSDIDLISLASYEDQPPKHLDNEGVRPKTVPESKIRLKQNCNGITARTTGRNRVQSAYDTDYKLNRKYQPQEREFKRRTWTKSETSIYKDFARTTRTFLAQKHGSSYQRKENDINRDCKSALEVRDPSSEPSVRSQTTCGFHPNEGNWIKSGKTNTQDVSSVGQTNKEVKIKRHINTKTDKSILNHIWRTRSAPTREQTNKTFPPKRRDSSHHDNFTVAESKLNKRPRSGWSEDKGERILKTKKTCVDRTDKSREEDVQSPTSSTVTRDVSGVIDDNEVVNVVCTSDDNYHSENRNLTEWEALECVENETVTCIVEKADENCNFNGNSKETVTSSVTNLNEDGVCSKDSGFASNAVTPELEFWNKSNTEDCKDELNFEKHKHVKFRIQNPETCVGLEEAETCSVISENGNSVTLSDAEIETESKVSEIAYDINDLISDLERIGANSRLSVISTGGQSNFTADGDLDSLSGDVAQKALRELREAEEQERAKLEEDNKELNKPKDLESLNMSKEARHAIMETLHDMGTMKGKKRSKEKDSADIRFKGVNAQRRQTNNRNKYEYYMRERTISHYKNQFKSIDSVGNEENSSSYSSPREAKECDDTSSEEYAKGKLFPSIRENTKLSKTTNSTSKSKVLTLDQAKKKKYKIPGIGNYHLIASPDNDFEITPPGFDSRYNPRPIISKEEMEIPPRIIREKSIQKCRSWLSNVNMSPMSLSPVKNTK
ncbi:uncharacterized protein LOC123532216 [Mercenaria mercenaria]|uniref:uncharacterized protein LOC123532216 n=1 Tax=Mercenaria mercenaria TaxID=6596 RepID=UPI00234F0983|nr:uncharacterized protein LOC123532216 [Mercenaria mercenaria]XP_045169535.2 uncharacterized protein LOC123532216 [Mercenaria mercenaria]XP_045169536.2 uncharacterized protein LOC123532216 [Mercenaria mercenaria]